MTTALPARAATSAGDDTAADFQLGVRASTYVADTSGGEVTLAPTAGAEFGGTALESGWTSATWATGGTSTVSGGQVSVDGSLLRTDATYAAGGSLQFDAVFSDVGYESVGLGSSLDGTPWAIFSTKSDGSDLMASVLNPADSASPITHYLDVACLGLCIGHPTHYRIDWTTTSVTFWINGTPVNTQAVTAMSDPMAVVISDLVPGDAKTVAVSSVRLSPYASSGTFTSRVFDAGGRADWGTFSWTGTVPAGTLTMEVRTGDTATPDGTWSAFTSITSGGDVTTYGRYLQYRATETTTDPTVTPALTSVTAAYTVDAAAPTISSHTPISDATGVAVSAKPAITFSESVAAASVTTSSVSVRAEGASSDVAASVATDGSTVTVTPSADLALGTRYTVTVSTAVTDLVGNPLASSASWSFTTAFGTLTTAVPTITGTVGVGHTLTADEGSWTPVPDFTYQWFRGSTQVGTARTYDVTSDDVGYQLSVEVTGTKTGYAPAARTSLATVTIAEGTLSTATPTISDTTPVIDQVLTADAGSWGPGPVVLAYQWLRDGAEISGATAQTYTVTGADAEHALSVRVRGTKANYTTASATSAATAAVPRGTLTTATPTISGTVVVGQVLTANPGTWGPAPVALAYQWLRGSSEINGATGKTYQVTGADAGSTLAVRVTGSRSGYTSVSMTSAATGKVPSYLAPNPTVTGVARVGMPLKADPGTWAPTPTKVSYQWYWLKKSGARVTIKHATKAVYTPTGSVQSHRLQVRVKAYRNGTLIATRYSGPTVKVAAGMTGRTPKISDTTPKVGQVLTAKPGTWKPTQTTLAYQWYARSTSGKVSKIAGATAATYQVAVGYEGYRIKVKVTGTAPDYKPVAKSSGYTRKITK